jgi:hypothetical protein
MGKIIASYLVKVHVHGDDEAEQLAKGATEIQQAPTNDVVKQAVELGAAVTVSLIERTDD